MLIEPDDSVRAAVATLLRGQGWAVEECGGAAGLADRLARRAFAAVISESSLPDASAQAVLNACSAGAVPVVFTGHATGVQAAVDLVRSGAVDYLDKPFPQKRLLDLLNDLFSRQNSGAARRRSDN